MEDGLLVRHCAPTLAGLKTGTMFACRFDREGDMLAALRGWNGRLVGKGVRVVPLRYGAGVGLMYMYRPELLAEDLAAEEAQQLLRGRGYPCGRAEQCIRQLQRRMAQAGEFPHEVGLFLGYPPEDVEGFICRRGQEKCSGCWKVFGDVQAAQCRFERYRACTAAYVRRYRGGMALEDMAVQTKSLPGTQRAGGGYSCSQSRPVGTRFSSSSIQ